LINSKTKKSLKCDMRSPGEMTNKDSSRAPRPKKKRILVVEDHDDERNMLRLILREYDVVAAGDHDEGLRLARRQYFDLYVLGSRAPDGTAIGLCRRIREFDPNTPILFCSRQTYSSDRLEAPGVGAHAYYAKPIEVQEVLRMVTNLLSATAQLLHEARHAEYVAIREELAVRSNENRRSVQIAAERWRRAVRKLLRVKAKTAFLNAGGARGDFARLWPATYLDAALDSECAKRESGN
jgi:DNA-binding response OmpR family regulator